MDEDAKAAFFGTSVGSRTMADGTLRVQIDISPSDAVSAFTAFGAPGSAVALARLTDASAVEHERPKHGRGEYGEVAKNLKLSGFFRSPAVWQAVGSDEEYLAWIKRQPCAVTGQYSGYDDAGEGYSIPAHVRRVGNGSGTAVKPPYSAIPLTDALHKKQHQHGETSIMPQEEWDKKRIQYVSKWAWNTLKAELGFESWSEIAPQTMYNWCKRKGVDKYLPPGYLLNVEKEGS